VRKYLERSPAKDYDEKRKHDKSCFRTHSFVRGSLLRLVECMSTTLQNGAVANIVRFVLTVFHLISLCYTHS
jgi:hypothetical protein